VAVLQHSHTVTSVALTESSEDIKPLVVASTMEEGLLLWDMTTDTTMHHKMTGITDVSCKNEKSDKGNWLLAVACGHQAKLLEAPSDGSLISRLKHLCSVEHEGKVTRVQHVPGALAHGAAIATCADNCVTLWSITGERLVVLQDPGLEITCFNLAPKGGGWLLAGGGRKVSIWPMRNGEVLSADSDTPVDTMNPPPLVQYEIAEGVRDVALDPHNKFIFISRQDNISELLDVHPKTPAKAVGSSGPSSRMVQSGQQTTIFELKHVGEPRER
jgi:WD40 repeat protein